MYIKKNFYIYIFHTSNVTPLFDLKKVALDNSQFFHTSILTPQTVKLVNGYGSQFRLLATAMKSKWLWENPSIFSIQIFWNCFINEETKDFGLSAASVQCPSKVALENPYSEPIFIFYMSKYLYKMNRDNRAYLPASEMPSTAPISILMLAIGLAYQLTPKKTYNMPIWCSYSFVQILISLGGVHSLWGGLHWLNLNFNY